tara:strand:+ start:113480 stop:113587 length:108 start_codon:yes stop_codon:yes gene_type:complete
MGIKNDFGINFENVIEVYLNVAGKTTKFYTENLAE